MPRPSWTTCRTPRRRPAPRSLAAWGRAALELVLPSSCPACGRLLPRPGPALCASCHGLVQSLGPPLCPCCGLPEASSGPGHLCGSCLKTPPPHDRARALFAYRAPVSTLIMDLKFNGRRQAARVLARLARDLDVELDEPDIILPVPLHPRRLRQRGFNQSLVLARALLPGCARRIRADLLLRQRHTPAQSTLDRRSRLANLRGAFVLRDPGALDGRHVLLVDDVYTTGTTVRECCQALRQGQPCHIEVLTVARSLPGPGTACLDAVP